MLKDSDHEINYNTDIILIKFAYATWQQFGVWMPS